jgi:hypothetical protein
MNIYTFKKQFEEKVQPAPSQPPIAAEQAWSIFKESILQGLDETRCEEIGFSLSTASYRDGKTVRRDENLFQVYFGRLIDAEEACAWHTAEINFYYRYAMNVKLRFLLSELHQQEIEMAFCSREESGVIRQKMETFFDFAFKQKSIWDEIRCLETVQTYFHFWMQ